MNYRQNNYRPHQNDQRIKMFIWLCKAPYLLFVYLKQKSNKTGEKRELLKKENYKNI